MSLTFLNFFVNFMLLTQFGYLTYLSWLRYRAGKNGLTPYLALVSSTLTLLVVIDMCYQMLIVAGLMGDTPAMITLQGIEVLVRAGLVMANTSYFIAIKSEAMAPLRRTTSTAREYIFDKLEGKHE